MEVDSADGDYNSNEEILRANLQEAGVIVYEPCFEFLISTELLNQMFYKVLLTTVRGRVMLEHTDVRYSTIEVPVMEAGAFEFQVSLC